MKTTTTRVDPLHPGHLLITGLSLGLPLLLYRARHLDDNTLTSWQWLFNACDPTQLYLILLLLSPLFWLLATAPARLHPFAAGRLSRLDRTGVIFIGREPATSRAIALLAFVICLLFLDTPETIVDSARYFIQAKSLSEYGIVYFFRQWGEEIFAWTDLPFISMLYGLLFTLTEEFRLPAQLLNALFFALTTLLIARLGRELWDEETGGNGALLFLGFPYIYSQTPLLLVDIGTMFFLTLCLYSFQLALTRGRVHLPLAAAAMVALFWCKFSGWILLSGVGPLLLLQIKQNWRVALQRAAAVLLMALAGMIAVSLPHLPVIAEQLELLIHFQGPALRHGWKESLSSTFLFQIHPIVTMLLLYSLFRALRRRDLAYAAVSWLVVLLIIVMEIRRIRYTMPIFPIMALLAGYGLRDLADPGLRRHLLLVVAGSAVLLARGALLPFSQSLAENNTVMAGRYLDSLELDGEVGMLVLSSPEAVLDPRVNLPLLDLFTRRRVYQLPSYSPASPPEWSKNSPLRFTWEMNLPPFLTDTPRISMPPLLVVISVGDSHKTALLPKHLTGEFGLLREFSQPNSTFQHNPRIGVFKQTREP